MNNSIKAVLITWSFIYVGLNNNWLSLKEAISLIEDNKNDLNVNDELLVDLYVNQDNESQLFTIIEKHSENNEKNEIRKWKFIFLKAIAGSASSIEDQLKEINETWSRFDYPEEWRSFISYLPSDQSNSVEEVHSIFLRYLAKEEQYLSERTI
tara:strand:- start:14078 stop:14536 length:459 start_codon:yes stop_codon:yes gene_type:complete